MHTHTSQSKTIALIHNGIIENYDSIKEELGKEDTVLKGNDAEVLTPDEEVQKKEEVSFLPFAYRWQK